MQKDKKTVVITYKDFILIILLILLPITIYKWQSTKPVHPIDQTTNQSLRVMTYNVHYFDKGVTGISKTITKLNPDLIGMQEVLIKNNVDRSKLLAKKLHYHQVSSSPYVHYGHKKWVLSFWSKKPIKRMDEIKLGNNRRAFRVDIDYDGQVVTFITLHLSPFKLSGNILKANYNRSRLRQKELRDLIKWIGSPIKRTVLLGDFNSLPFMGELKPLMREGFKDVYTDLNQSNAGTFNLNLFISNRIRKHLPKALIPQRVTLDYILISKGLKGLSVSVDPSEASDHYPLLARIAIVGEN